MRVCYFRRSTIELHAVADAHTAARDADGTRAHSTHTRHRTRYCRVCGSCVATATPHILEIGSCTRPPSKRARTEHITRGNGNESRFKPSAFAPRRSTFNVEFNAKRKRRARHSASDRHTANHPIPISEYMHTTCTTNMQHPHPHPHAHAHAHAHNYTTSVQSHGLSVAAI